MSVILERFPINDTENSPTVQVFHTAEDDKLCNKPFLLQNSVKY